MEDDENKYRVGDSVYAKATPDIELIVRRYIKRIYYCTVPGHPDAKDRVLFEREILNTDAE